jgi:hypothetical protein
MPEGSRNHYLPGHYSRIPGQHGGPRKLTPPRWVVLYEQKCNLGYWHTIRSKKMVYRDARKEVVRLKDEGARDARLEEVEADG